MAHLFIHRPRILHLNRLPHETAEHHRWEIIRNSVYLFGGVVYIVGSLLFLPQFSAYGNIGGWVFFLGSLLYFVVSFHDMMEVIKHHRHQGQITMQTRLEQLAAATYLAGATLFTAGRIVFLLNDVFHVASHWCFIIGSLLFIIGACINIMQIVQAPSLFTLQLMNLTAVAFVAGSLLFTVASVPYLWHIDQSTDQRLLYMFLAWQYLFGSALFLIGGVFNAWRTYVMHQNASNRARAN